MRGATTTLAIALGIGLLASGPAWAGDLKIGKDPLETDGDGKLTKAAQAAAVTEVEAEAGNEAWVLHLWAQIDNPAQGPLYVEFYRQREGKELVAHRHEIADYAGDKYVSVDVEIDRSEGFRPGETVDLAFVQNVGGKDAKKAKAKVSLLASSVPEPAPEEDAPEEDAPEEDAPEEDDAAASEPEPAAAPAGPPPVEPSETKGCRVGAEPGSAGWWSVLALVLVARTRRTLTGS
jgi:MYXO-CTERM domain-containing protein